MRWGNMAYAYRSTGRDTVMSEDRVKGLEIALRYVLMEVRSRGVDVDALTEAVSDRLVREPVSAEDAACAVIEIEVAADSLHYPVE